MCLEWPGVHFWKWRLCHWMLLCACLHMRTHAHTHAYMHTHPTLLQGHPPHTALSSASPDPLLVSSELAENLASSLPELPKLSLHQKYSWKWKSPEVLRREFEGPLTLTTKDDRRKFLRIRATIEPLTGLWWEFSACCSTQNIVSAQELFVETHDGRKGNAWGCYFQPTLLPQNKSETVTCRGPSYLGAQWQAFWGSTKQLRTIENGSWRDHLFSY